MFNILKSSTASVLALAISAGAAAAVSQSIVFTDFTPVDNFVLSQFNTALGTLESVSWSGGLTATGFPGVGSASIFFQPVGAFDNAIGTASITASLSGMITTGMSAFEGLGTVSAFASAPISAGTVVSGSFTITYTYDDGVTPAPIPLPAGAPLLVAGLGGLALLRKKRKS